MFFESKYNKLLSLYHRLNEIRNLIPRAEKAKVKKNRVYKNSVNLDNTLLAIFLNFYSNIIDEKKKRWIKNMIPVICFLKDIIMMNGTKK